MTKAQAQRVIGLHAQGHECQFIADWVGLRRNDVARMLRRRGHTIPHGQIGRPSGSGKWSTIALMRLAGESYSAIGRMLGMHHASVLYAVRRMSSHLDLTPRCEPIRLVKRKPKVTQQSVDWSASEVRLQEKYARVEREKYRSDLRVETMMRLAERIAKRKWRERSIA